MNRCKRFRKLHDIRSVVSSAGRPANALIMPGVPTASEPLESGTHGFRSRALAGAARAAFGSSRSGHE